MNNFTKGFIKGVITSLSVVWLIDNFKIVDKTKKIINSIKNQKRRVDDVSEIDSSNTGGISDEDRTTVDKYILSNILQSNRYTDKANQELEELSNLVIAGYELENENPVDCDELENENPVDCDELENENPVDCDESEKYKTEE